MIDSFRRLLDQPVRTDEPKLCFLENPGRRETGFAFPDGQRLAHFEFAARPLGTDRWSVLLDSIRAIPSAGSQSHSCTAFQKSIKSFLRMAGGLHILQMSPSERGIEV
jgi:hypothetical protein